MSQEESGKAESRSRRVIEVKDGVIGPAPPRQRTAVAKTPGDYPGVKEAYIEIAKSLSSPLLFGPPLCDELMELVLHMFTDEEADLVQHLKPLSAKNVQQLADASRRPVEEVRAVMDSLAHEKRVVLSRKKDGDKRYMLLPVAPGTFEHVLIRTSMDTLTEWHRRFTELFEALFETAYLADYAAHPSALVRYVPVDRSISVHPMALPSDKLPEILDRYDSFGMGLCQCRMTEQIVGRGCDKPMLNCTVMGEIADDMIARDMLKRVSRNDVLEIKREAEEHGLVTWMINEESGNWSSCSCSCCGCCCHMLRTVNELNAPGWIAPPHFMPAIDPRRCTYCGKCARACPMGALVVDTRAKTIEHLSERCIGCGLCAVACDKEQAVRMEPRESFREPPKGWFSLLARTVPIQLYNAFSVWMKRK